MNYIVRKNVIQIALTCSLLLWSGFAFASGDAKRVSAAELTSAATVRTPPQLSPVARQLKLHGTVEVDVTVDENGAVQQAAGLRGNPILLKSAVDAVKNWKFRPFKEGSVVATLHVEFAENN